MKTLILALLGSIIFSPMSEAGIGGFGSKDVIQLQYVEFYINQAIAQAAAGESIKESLRMAERSAQAIETERLRLRIIAMLNNKDIAANAKSVLEEAAREIREAKTNPGAGITASSIPVKD